MPLTLRLSPLLFSLTAGLVACGSKPSPSEPAAPTQAQTKPDVSSVPGQVPKVQINTAPSRTFGGVELAGHLIGEESVREEVRAAALELSDHPDKGAKRLIEAKDAAHGVIVALLHSKSRNELQGALNALKVLAPDAPELKAKAQAHLNDLLKHELFLIREQATAVIGDLYTGDELLTLVSSWPESQLITLVPLLAQWDSPGIRQQLVTYLRSSSSQLAHTAALAFGHPGRPISPEFIAIVKEFLGDESKLPLVSQLLANYPPEMLTSLEGALLDAVDKGLVSKSQTNLFSAIRLLQTLPVSERIALQEQVGQDPRDEVRRLIAEGLASRANADETKRLMQLASKLSEDLDGHVRLAGVRALSALVSLQDAKEHGRLAPMAVERLSKSLNDSNQSVMLAAIASLSAPELAPHADEALVKLYDKLDPKHHAFLLEAMVMSKSRAQLEFVLSKLDGASGWAQGHLALQRLSGEDHIPRAEAWMPWLNAKYPKP